MPHQNRRNASASYLSSSSRACRVYVLFRMVEGEVEEESCGFGRRQREGHRRGERRCDYGVEDRESRVVFSRSDAIHQTPATATTSISQRRTSAKNAGVSSGQTNWYLHSWPIRIVNQCHPV